MAYHLKAAAKTASPESELRLREPQTHVALRQVSVTGQRYYSPEIGRWLRRDPIGETIGFNLSLFVRNQPTLDVDGLGLSGNLEIAALRFDRLGVCGEYMAVVSYLAEPPGWVIQEVTVKGLISEKKVTVDGKECCVAVDMSCEVTFYEAIPVYNITGGVASDTSNGVKIPNVRGDKLVTKKAIFWPASDVRFGDQQCPWGFGRYAGELTGKSCALASPSYGMCWANKLDPPYDQLWNNLSHVSHSVQTAWDCCPEEEQTTGVLFGAPRGPRVE